jgi:hypothetical protein
MKIQPSSAGLKNNYLKDRLKNFNLFYSGRTQPNHLEFRQSYS